MAFADLSGEGEPFWAGDGAGEFELATNDGLKVVDVGSDEYAKNVAEGRQQKAQEVIAALHVVERVGGRFPTPPWEIPETS